MSDTRLYLVQIAGHVSAETINASSPIKMVVTPKDGTTQCIVRTDQSGLIGLLRYLHTRNLVFLSISSNLEQSGESHVP
ncbi:MAG: hypothetical protein JW730_04510 [Anaerolineales bacterium]|nr:hypothetical protein [Anaerolineales bacterium]